MISVSPLILNVSLLTEIVREAVVVARETRARAHGDSGVEQQVQQVVVGEDVRDSDGVGADTDLLHLLLGRCW